MPPEDQPPQETTPKEFGLFKQGDETPPAELAAAAAGDPPAPEPEDDPKLKRGWDDLTRRDQEVAEREKQVANMAKAQKLIAEGRHKEAAEAMGMDTTALLSQAWGKDFVPAEPEPAAPGSPEELAEIKEILQQQNQQIAQLTHQSVAAQHYQQIGKVMQDRDDLQLVRHLAAQYGDGFYDNIVQYANKEEQDKGFRPQYADLLERVEDDLIDRYCDDYQNLVKIPKIKERLEKTPATQEGLPPAAKPTPRAPKPASPPPARSLSNKMSAEPPEEPTRPRTREERRDAFMSVMRTKGWRDEEE